MVPINIEIAFIPSANADFALTIAGGAYPLKNIFIPSIAPSIAFITLVTSIINPAA